MERADKREWRKKLGREELEAALSRLEPRLAVLVRLHRQGLPHSEIARRLEVPNSHVEVRNFRAYRRLRQIVEQAHQSPPESG